MFLNTAIVSRSKPNHPIFSSTYRSSILVGDTHLPQCWRSCAMKSLNMTASVEPRENDPILPICNQYLIPMVANACVARW